MVTQNHSVSFPGRLRKLLVLCQRHLYQILPCLPEHRSIGGGIRSVKTNIPSLIDWGISPSVHLQTAIIQRVIRPFFFKIELPVKNPVWILFPVDPKHHSFSRQLHNLSFGISRSLIVNGDSLNQNLLAPVQVKRQNIRVKQKDRSLSPDLYLAPSTKIKRDPLWYIFIMV